MTALIVGLGNPGPEYVSTRHNIGFLALDRLREVFGAPEFRPESKFSAELSSAAIDGQKVILAKPTTYMNESGRAVRAVLDYYKLDSSSLIVIHDDLDLATGTLRTTDSSRAAGHNGVQDVIDTLGTQDFFRIRIGIGRPAEVEGVCMPSHDYVLGRFSAEESAGHAALFDGVVEAVRERLGA
jgi:PTH1 family peptidyl-tRNA hydrolase